MTFDVSTALNLILFLALLPIGFFWLRRAWRIFFRRDFSEVALRRGLQPADPVRFAPYTGVLNLVCGTIVATTVLAVLGWQLPFEVWSAIAGSTIWCKFIADFAIGWHAHRFAAAATAPAARGGPAR